MSFDLDGLIRDLNDLIGSIEKSGTNGKQITRSSKIMGLDVSTNVSIRVGLLEPPSPPGRDEPPNSELLDVFDNDDSVKVVALIPGINKEDIETNISDGLIEVRIRRGGSTLCKSIPCNVKPDRISVASFTCNNSVLEIIFKKGANHASSR